MQRLQSFRFQSLEHIKKEMGLEKQSLGSILKQQAFDIFKKLDTKGDGHISTKDAANHLVTMKEAFKNLGIHVKDEYFKTMIEEMDTDKSGTVRKQLKGDL